jgi:hypothetical protein
VAAGEGFLSLKMEYCGQILNKNICTVTQLTKSKKEKDN